MLKIKKIIGRLICDITQKHEFIQIQKKELIHPATSKKISHFAGRVKEEIVLYKCQRCGLIRRQNTYIEHDHYYVD